VLEFLQEIWENMAGATKLIGLPMFACLMKAIPFQLKYLTMPNSHHSSMMPWVL
jgi:hypothetical protein